jgi:hypothetical protein
VLPPFEGATVSNECSLGARALACALLILGLAACGGGDMPGSVITSTRAAPERTTPTAMPSVAGAPTAASAAAPIVIRHQPASADAREGEVVQFEVDAQAAGSLRYQWLRNGLPIEGQTGPMLRLRAIPEDHLARVSVVVQAGGAAQQSEPALLRVSGF